MPMEQQPSSGGSLNQYFDRACQAHADGRFGRALQGIPRLLDLGSGFGPAALQPCLVYYELTRYSDSLRAFAVADSLTPGDVDTLFNLALCHGKSGDRLSAITFYEQVLALCADHVDSLYNLGGCYQHLHQDDRAATITAVCWPAARLSLSAEQPGLPPPSRRGG